MPHHITGILRDVPYLCCSFITAGLWRLTWILMLVGALNHKDLGNNTADRVCLYERERQTDGEQGWKMIVHLMKKVYDTSACQLK